MAGVASIVTPALTFPGENIPGKKKKDIEEV
jgi:hypothetical protein